MLHAFAHSADKQMPNFQDIWKNHPNVRGDVPLLDKAAYENQCAINFSAALMRTGVDFRTFRGAWSWQQGATKYPIRAQEVANWVAAGGTRLPISIEKFTGAQAFGRAEGSAGMKNRTGLVFFQNYWGPGMQGDHIDLWNGSRLTDRGSWLRIHARIGSFGIHSILSDVSDMEKAQAVWFWQFA